MNKSNKRIIVTGGDGRFAKVLKKTKNKLDILYPGKKQLNILSLTSLKKYIKKYKPKYLIHCAGLSRPMNIHNNNISKSIDLNIIGTANITKICSLYNIKLIYFSTAYVYQGKKGNYKENDPLLPINNYEWSKLGGECSVTMYKNSLILRIMMCEKPFLHSEAFTDVKTNFIFHEDVAKIIPKILEKKGILNIGGETQSVYSFTKKSNKNIKKISARKKMGRNFPLNPSMNISKLKNIL